MRKHVAVGAVLLLALGVGSYAVASGEKSSVKADGLAGYQENPDISTTAAGSFEAQIDDAARTIDYTLTYADLEGTVQQAHVHFGKRALNGGISVWLCSNLASPPTPADTPACPSPGGTVSGTLEASDVVGPTGQGFEPGAFDELVAAIRAGNTYANVHSTKWPGGEIRGQINDQNQRQ